MCVLVCAWTCMCVVVWLRGTTIQICVVRSGLVTGDSDLYSLWTRYAGDSKTEPRDDLEICNDSYSEDPTMIQIQNRVIHMSVYFSIIAIYHYK